MHPFGMQPATLLKRQPDLVPHRVTRLVGINAGKPGWVGVHALGVAPGNALEKRL